MADVTTLDAAVRDLIRDGDSVVLEGFSHLVPFAAARAIIRQQRRDLTIVRMSADLIADQLIGAGCVRKLIFSWAGNPGLGLLPRFRDAVEHGWPRAIELEEHSHAGLAAALVAGAANLPFGVLRGYAGTDLVGRTPSVATVTCPFTGETLAAVRALRPDVAVIHAQQADRAGNVLLWGVTGVQKEAVLAAGRSLVTVEEIVETLDPHAPGVRLPAWVVTAVAHAPGGARPSYAHGYYQRDNEFSGQWNDIARDRTRFQDWMAAHA